MLKLLQVKLPRHLSIITLANCFTVLHTVLTLFALQPTKAWEQA